MDKEERKLRIKLEKLLYAISDDEDFIDGIFSEMETPEDVQTVIDYIERGVDVDPTQISLLSIDIGKAHDSAKATEET